MWTGPKALKNIDQKLQDLRADVVRLDSELDQYSQRVSRDQRHRLKLINDIASVRLAEIERDNLLFELDAADQEAMQLLEQRESALKKLDQQISSNNSDIDVIERSREDSLDKHNQVSQELDDLEAKVQADLQHDAAYLAQFEKARRAESVAEEAEEKCQRAQTDLAEKAAPYQADDLFMYLWDRGFGTTEYMGGLFARFMDSWVARLIKYEPSRVNFWNLTEIPKRLSEHAKHVAQSADDQHMQLQQLELDALANAGKERVEERLEFLRAELDKADDELESLEDELNQNLSQRAAFVAGEDRFIQAALSRLGRALEHRDLESVYQYVRATISPTDDQLVNELKTLEQRSSSVKGDLADVRSLHNRKLSQLKELEAVRQNFKNARYDDVRSSFANEAIIANVLAQFIQGLVSGSDVWRALKRNQRYRDIGALPDFGSGGLGEIADVLGSEILRQGRRRTKRRGSTWHWPRPRRGGGGFRFPSGGGVKFPSGGGGGGGFKTGGGF